jgi:hypothetical protein
MAVVLVIHEVENWLKTQPSHVKGAAELFPITTPFQVHGRMYWVIGYTVLAELIAIHVDPAQIDDATFKRLAHAAVLFEPAAIVGIATRH